MAWPRGLEKAILVSGGRRRISPEGLRIDRKRCGISERLAGAADSYRRGNNAASQCVGWRRAYWRRRRGRAGSRALERRAAPRNCRLRAELRSGQQRNRSLPSAPALVPRAAGTRRAREGGERTLRAGSQQEHGVQKGQASMAARFCSSVTAVKCRQRSSAPRSQIQSCQMRTTASPALLLLGASGQAQAPGLVPVAAEQPEPPVPGPARTRGEAPPQRPAAGRA